MKARTFEANSIKPLDFSHYLQEHGVIDFNELSLIKRSLENNDYEIIWETINDIVKNPVISNMIVFGRKDYDETKGKIVERFHVSFIHNKPVFKL